MKEKYVVRLSEPEREELEVITKKLSGSSQKVRRANILLKADANGPNWPDKQIAEAFSCRIRTIEKVRKRLVTEGFDAALNRKVREEPPRRKKLNGRQEAKLIALALGSPPKGYSSWTLRLLAREAVELEIADSISHETVRKTLKKTDSQLRRYSIG
jgi:transposase